MFLLVNNRPIQSADSIGFWPIVSVSADSQNSTIGRPLDCNHQTFGGLIIKTRAKRVSHQILANFLEETNWFLNWCKKSGDFLQMMTSL